MSHGRARVAGQQTRIGTGTLARQGLPFGLAGLLVWYMADNLRTIDPAAVVQALQSLHPLQWLAGLAATCVSFWAVGRYDGVVQRQMGSAVPPAAARRAGIAAIAISQTVGMGLLTGALVRWRMLPGLSLWQTTRLSLVVALSFLAGWAVVASVTILLLPLRVPYLTGGAAATLALAASAVLIATLRPGPFANWPFPPLLTIGRILLLAAIDTGAAACAFILLVPDMAHLAPLALLPAFLLALGAGLATGTPGGVGPFEMTLLALVPTTNPEPLLAAILAFRLTYYAIPALLAAALLIIGPKRQVARRVGLAPSSAPLPAAARAEAQLIHQGPFAHWSSPGQSGGWLVAETGQAIVVLGVLAGPQTSPSPPLQTVARQSCRRSRSTPLADHLNDLRQLAQSRDRVLAHYKCPARLAATLRQSGYAVLLTGHEAKLRPQSFTLNTPARAALRRKLRKATQSGLFLTRATSLPLAEMAEVSAAWVSRHGAERGFSMGRFTPAAAARQQVYLAHRGDELVAFVTFHHTPTEWTLDLMRHTSATPEGAIYALIARAIADAAAAGVTSLSLAAVPAERRGPLCRLIDRATGGAGLRQFKSTFAPEWHPLYLAAPSRPALAIAGLEIARAIAFPPPHSTGRYPFTGAEEPSA